ncbi:uncharacterized protein, partial [Penaeus vannamei]|uniref:uncharacterized protein n=1 Tax=Penaeus vannamei TaxID=6689 RepID=UPI00387F6B6A
MENVRERLRCQVRRCQPFRALVSTLCASEFDAYRNLYAKGSTPGIMYGLPKVHKDAIPLRPILSAIGTCSYQLAKFLVLILTPLTPNTFTVKDSFTFAKEITNISFDKCCMRDGVAMGSPLGPTLANAFLSHEHIWLSNCPIPFKPLYYKRFVDDTFLIFKSQEHGQEFLSYLNSQHPNVKFTV